MDFLWDSITEWLKELLVGGIISNLSGMFDHVNQKVGEISTQVGTTPQGWNSGVFSMVQNLSETVIVPIAGMILAFVMTLELIQLIIDKNNLNDVDTWMFFKWIFKTAAAILIVTNGACFVMRAKDEIEHIFSELYSVPDRLQKPYFMLKVQELLLFLCMVDVNKEKQRELYTSPQVEIVRDIHKRLISNLQERPTIEELSKEYLINTATLKDTFKGVYGQPIGTYMKVYRMKQAAALLRQTQATIAEIANQVGYENQSKFATAFRDVFKIAPAEYRKQNSGD